MALLLVEEELIGDSYKNDVEEAKYFLSEICLSADKSKYLKGG